MSQLVPPHNSEQVKPLLLPETERAEERKRAEKLRKIPLDSRAVSDIFMLAMGAYTPLDGFMRHDDWRGSCLDMKRVTLICLLALNNEPSFTLATAMMFWLPARRIRVLSNSTARGRLLR